MTRVTAALATVLALSACGSDDPPAGSVAPDGGGPAVPGAAEHIVGSGAKAYAEKSEVSNACAVTPEDAAYTLDEAGIVISGTFEAATPTVDCFSFKSGTATNALVRVFVNGSASTAPHLKCSGYSESVVAPATGKGPVQPNLTCTVGVYPTAAEVGLTYTIELKVAK